MRAAPTINPLPANFFFATMRPRSPLVRHYHIGMIVSRLAWLGNDIFPPALNIDQNGPRDFRWRLHR